MQASHVITLHACTAALKLTSLSLVPSLFIIIIVINLSIQLVLNIIGQAIATTGSFLVVLVVVAAVEEFIDFCPLGFLLFIGEVRRFDAAAWWGAPKVWRL